MNFRFYNARILTLEETKDVFQGELWVKDNLISYCGTLKDIPYDERNMFFDREIDLHGNLIHIDKCDLCLIAGDVVPLNIQKNRVESIVWFFQDFLPWIKELPCEEVYMVAGNHEF